MKSYKQMAEDVLHRAEVYTIRRKRNQRIAVTAAAFGCLSVLIAVNIIKIGMGTTGDAPFVEQPPAHMESQPTEASKPTEGDQLQVQPSIPSSGEELPNDVKQNFDVVLLVATSPDDPGTELVENLTLPMNYFLRVRDLRGLSKTEREKIINEEREFCQEQSNSSLAGASVRYIRNMPRENYVISFVRTGCFRLKIEDYEQVESIRIACTTKYGQVDVQWHEPYGPKGQEVELYPENISEWDKQRGLRINWQYTSELLFALDEDPSMPLSSFSDIVTFTVRFLDGTVQESRVRVAIREDGEIFICLLGETVTA